MAGGAKGGAMKTRSESEVSNHDITAAINALEDKFDSKITALEDRVINTVQDFIKAEIESVKKEVNAQIGVLRDRVQALEASSQAAEERARNAEPDRSLNIAIKDLPQSENEVVKHKVEALLKDGMKVKDVKIKMAVRKEAFRADSTGVVIATLESKGNKEKVMNAKATLKGSRQYSTVYVDHDKSAQQRRYEANMRLLVNTVAKESLDVRGSRLVRKTDAGRDQGQGDARNNVENRGVNR